MMLRTCGILGEETEVVLALGVEPQALGTTT
jgi:hypothetical protein